MGSSPDSQCRATLQIFERKDDGVGVEQVAHHHSGVGSGGGSAGGSQSSPARQPANFTKCPTGQPFASTAPGRTFVDCASSIASRTKRSSLDAESGSSFLRVVCRSTASVLMMGICHKPPEIPRADFTSAISRPGPCRARTTGGDQGGRGRSGG